MELRKYTNVREELPFPALSAMIRLGRKYQIDHLRDEGLARLKLEFPSTLEDWDSMDGDKYTHISWPDLVSGSTIAATIKLAHECNIQSILPALYLLYAPTMVSRRATRLHGHDALITLVGQDNQLFMHPDSLPVPYAALRSCVIGCGRLREAAAGQILGWRQRVGGIETCVAKKSCQNASRRLMRDLLRGDPIRNDVMESFENYEKTEAGLTRLRDLCGPCKEYARKAHEDGREAVWTALPIYFQLPAWGDLKDFEG